MFKFLPGIIFVQAATVALVVAIVNTAHEGYWAIIGVLALFISCLTAFWFGSIAKNISKDDLALAREHFAQEREDLRVTAEKEKINVIEESHKKIVKETSRAHAKASFKLGAAFIGTLGAGVLMLFTELLTLGFLTLATAGGTLAGYLIRARQDFIARKRHSAQTSLYEARASKLLDVNPPPNKTSLIKKRNR